MRLPVALALLALLALLCLYRYSSATMAASGAVAAAATAAAATAAPGLSSLIFLHGLGDSGAGWAFLRGELSPRFPRMRFAFPNSPTQPVTLAGGEAMPSWMDLDDLPVTARTPEDREGYEASTKLVHALIDREVAAGVPANRIFLGGFSQGACGPAGRHVPALPGVPGLSCAHPAPTATFPALNHLPPAGGSMSLYAGLKYPQLLGGIVCFSGWLPQKLWDAELSKLPSAAATKFLLVHGSLDSKVDFERGTTARDLLQQRAPKEAVRFVEFRGDHTFYAPSLEALAQFLA